MRDDRLWVCIPLKWDLTASLESLLSPSKNWESNQTKSCHHSTFLHETVSTSDTLQYSDNLVLTVSRTPYCGSYWRTCGQYSEYRNAPCVMLSCVYGGRWPMSVAGQLASPSNDYVSLSIAPPLRQQQQQQRDVTVSSQRLRSADRQRRQASLAVSTESTWMNVFYISASWFILAFTSCNTVTYLDGLPVRRRSPIQVLTGPEVD